MTDPSDDLWQARSHGRLAVGLHSLGDLATASLEFKKQVGLAKAGIRDNTLFREELFLGYHNMGRHLYRASDTHKAEHYFNKCYSLVDENDFQMGFLLNNHAQCCFAQSRYDDALHKAKKALTIGEQLGIDRILIYAYPVLATLSRLDNNNDEATEYLLHGCQLATNANLSLVQLQLCLLEHYLEIRQHTNASNLLEEMDTPTDTLDISRLYLLKSQYYEVVGNHKEALKNHKLSHELQEQLTSLKKRDHAHASSVVRRIRVIERNYRKECKKNAKLIRYIKSARKVQRELKALAERDELTGLYNRRQFMKLANASLNVAKESSSTICFAIIDIDHFKQVNDSFGHPVGDQVLRVLGDVSTAILREDDIVARFGGEEFVVLMPDTDIAGAEVALQRFRKSFMNHDWSGIHPELQPTFSCGFAQADKEYRFSDVMTVADANLYTAKDQGRNCVVPVLDEGSS